MGASPYISSTAEGVRIKLRVKPGARSSRVVGIHGDLLKVDVNAPPERGRANEALCRLFAELTGLPLRNVDVAVGETSQNKTITIRGIDLESARAVISAALTQ